MALPGQKAPNSDVQLQKTPSPIIITAYMNKTYGTKKYAADKIVLLGLFIVAVLIARFIVASRSAIILWEPIKLDFASLSVSMPAGNGWQSEKQWRFQKNAFILSGVFDAGSGKVTASAQCRYRLASTEATADERLKQKASAMSSTIVKTDQIQTDQLTIDWVHIKTQKMLDTFFGTATLSNNHQCDIEVHQTAGDTDMAEQVFKRITESLKLEDNQLLQAGGDIIAQIKSKGLASFLSNQNQQSFFLIKDLRKHTIGFTMDVLVDTGPDAKLNIQAGSFFYIRGRFARESAKFFQSTNNFDEFTWSSETNSIAGRIGTEVILGKDEVMTVKKFSPQTEEKNYRISPEAIPEVLLEQLLSQMLDSDHKKILVEVIENDGTIVPALISRIEAEDSATDEERAQYILKVELLDGRGYTELVYLDSQRHISKRLSLYKRGLILERATVENILRQFPERADYILQKNKMLEQNQPQY